MMITSEMSGSELIQADPSMLQNGITHAFVFEFENEQDREFYLKEDPAHLEFVKSIAGVVSKVQVVDFTPGVF